MRMMLRKYALTTSWDALAANRLSRPALFSTTTGASHSSNSSEIKCLECGGQGHRAKDCPKAAGTAKRNVQDLFRQGKCLLCGEVGHEAKHCPTIGGNPAESKPLIPQPQKPTLAERHANKICMSCGTKGHVMRDCPTNPNRMRVKGITERYSGSRLQKMLPDMLKEQRSIGPAHESLAGVAPQVGIVISTSAQKTIGVLVRRTMVHPKLRVTLDRSRKFLVHDESEKAMCGDVVLIQQTRPISKNKNFTLKEILVAHNAQLDTVAQKVADMKKLYAGIDEEAIATLQKLRARHSERVAELKKRESTELQEARTRIQTEMNESLKDVNLIAEELSKESEKQNTAWLEQMKQKLDAKAQWAKDTSSDNKSN